MATHSSSLAWKLPWTEKPGGVTVKGGGKELNTTERARARARAHTHTHTHTHTSAIKIKGRVRGYGVLF